ncbi:protein SPMIP2 [Megaptera novaeangliae]
MACVSFREPVSTTVGKRMVFTGPDYVKDHLPEVAQHTSYIGEKRPALEKTGDLRYLRRPASKRSLPAKYKPEYVGEIGWGIPAYDFINKRRLQTGFHVKYEEFSQAAVEKLSHRYQNPWQPNPSIMDAEGSFSRGFIAWHMGDYEDTNQRNSKRAILLRQSQAALPRVSRPPKLPKLPKEQEVQSFAFRHHHRKSQPVLTCELENTI